MPTSWRPILVHASSQHPRIPEVRRHRVAASDRRSLYRNNAARHELRPGHAVTVPTLRRVHWDDTDRRSCESGSRLHVSVRNRTLIIFASFYVSDEPPAAHFIWNKRFRYFNHNSFLSLQWFVYNKYRHAHIVWKFYLIKHFEVF